MQHCPSEILHCIFSYACLDGGKTGASLALVSKHIQEVSEPYQLQSVAVCDLQAAQVFLRRLENTSPPGRMVRYLRFSNSGDEWGNLRASDHERPSPSSSEHSVLKVVSNIIPGMKRRRDQREAAYNHQADVRQMEETLRVFVKIVEYISLTLRALTIKITCPFPEHLSLQDLSSMNLQQSLTLPSLPYLVALTFRDHYGSPRNIFTYCDPAQIMNPTSLPRVKYLDLIGLRFTRDHRNIRTAVESLGSLTHLRFPGEWHGGLEMFDLHADREGKLLPAINHCYIQAESTPPPIWGCSTGAPPDERTADLFKLLPQGRLAFLVYKDADLDIEDIDDVQVRKRNMPRK